MENFEILYLSMVLFTCYGFTLAQGLRAAINNYNDIVRTTAKILMFYILHIGK